MKKRGAVLIVLFMAVIGFSHVALAADAKPLWSGPYVGFNVGQGSGSWEDSFSVNNVKGSIAGAEIGYNLQRPSHLILTVAADLSIAGIKGQETVVSTYNDIGYSASTTTTSKAMLDRFATLRGRLGYAFRDRFLVYGTTGIALARIKAERTAWDTTDNNGVLSSYSYSNSGVNNEMGWVFGGGAEYAITHDWSGKVEYLRMEMQGIGMESPLATVGVVRLGVNFRF